MNINIIWRDIKTAPEGVVVMVSGKTGYIAPNDKFLMLATLVNGVWKDHANDRLDESGLHPSAWGERIPLAGETSQTN